MNYYIEVLKKYAVFSGRAGRREYWMFVLFNVIISIVISVIGTLIGGKINILPLLYSLAVFLPSTAVTFRRLHDTNHSGWWLFINLIPIIGFIIFLVFMIKGSQPSDNQYGASAKK